MVVKKSYRRRYVRAYYQMRTGFLRSTVYCTGDRVGVPHALKANRRMNNNNINIEIYIIIKAVKYIYKYIYKGFNRVTLEI